jgi:hypothetical protein
MPFGDGQPVQVFPAQLSVPTTNGLFISAQVQSDGTATDEVVEGTLQSLIDHLQTWPGRDPGANVTGQVYSVLLFPATPTNPIPPPPPPPDN